MHIWPLLSWAFIELAVGAFGSWGGQFWYSPLVPQRRGFLWALCDEFRYQRTCIRITPVALGFIVQWRIWSSLRPFWKHTLHSPCQNRGVTANTLQLMCKVHFCQIKVISEAEILHSWFVERSYIIYQFIPLNMFPVSVHSSNLIWFGFQKNSTTQVYIFSWLTSLCFDILKTHLQWKTDTYRRQKAVCSLMDTKILSLLLKGLSVKKKIEKAEPSKKTF